jgi:glycosyltransferase involved in cell wall biosynthesis
VKIAIDISQIVYDTGVSQYVKSLVTNLLKIDHENKYLLFAGTLRRREDIQKFLSGLENTPESKIFPLPPVAAGILWNDLHILPIEKLIGSADVFHSSDWAEPPSKMFKVTTVHDLAPFLFPDLFPRDLIRNIVNTHKLRMRWVREETDRVIVPTNATKNDLMKLGFNESVIRVIPEAVSDSFKPMDEQKIEVVKRKYKLYGNYVLSVGMDKRKNTERIIKAFDQASPGKDLKLIFVGQPKYMKIEETRNIRMLGHISREDLPAIYSGARALVYPSLYEGFGLPILEAFACDCPVVTSNTSSMAEVAGDAAKLVDPYDVESIKEGVDEVLRGPKSFIEKGEKRVKEFSWEKTAKMTLDVYREAKK